jgi:predicted metallopeptidase
MPRSIKSSKRVEWVSAPDIEKKIKNLVISLRLDWIKRSRIFCFRSKNSKTRAHARIWGFSRIWQQALKAKPAYIIEVISEKFDKLPDKEKDKVLLHELAHVPKNFSGSLVPHYRRGKRKFKDRVRTLVAQYNKIRE